MLADGWVVGSLGCHVGGVFRVHTRLPFYHRFASVTPPTWYLPARLPLKWTILQ
jgi:hypothetical protein